MLLESRPQQQESQQVNSRTQHDTKPTARQPRWMTILHNASELGTCHEEVALGHGYEGGQQPNQVIVHVTCTQHTEALR